MGALLKRATFKATNSHQLSIVVVPIIMVVLATICVALRFRARKLMKSTCMFDDWLCLVALILTWSFQAVNLAAVFVGGAGLPIETVMAIDPTAIVTFLKIIMVNFLLWVVTVSVVQLSILFFYIRLFGVVEMFRWVCYIFVALITGFGIAGFFSELLSCLPISKSWNPMKSGSCVDGHAYCSAIGIIHVIFDFGIVFLPMPLIWQLKLAWQSKFILSLLLCLGLVASIISLLKIVCLFDLTGIPQDDITDYLWLTILLQTLELPIGIICCCVPSLKPVMGEMAPKFNSMTSWLMSYTRSTGSTASRTNPSGVESATSSTNGFARLDDGASQAERSSLGSKTSAHGADVELADRGKAQPGSRSEVGSRIEVVSAYSVSRQ